VRPICTAFASDEEHSLQYSFMCMRLTTLHSFDIGCVRVYVKSLLQSAQFEC